MSASTITSIEKYVLLKSPAARPPARSPDGRLNMEESTGYAAPNDRYENRFGQDDVIESRLARQNRMAIAFRDTDQTTQQIHIGINQMEDALDAVVKQYPPYPPGSEQRIAALRKVNTFRKQIEQLTFPPVTDENAGIRSMSDSNPGMKTKTSTIETIEADYKNSLRKIVGEFDSTKNAIPELAEDAQDEEIKASILQLREAGAFIRQQRHALESEDSLFLVNGKEFLSDKQVTEQKSMFIGKHLSRHPDSGLTTTPSILTGFLN